jgi:Rieske Fe-S protein
MQPEHPPPAHTPAEPGRRSFLRWITYATGAVAAVVLAVPVVGYFFGIRKRSREWVKDLRLGPGNPLPPVSQLPVGETLRVLFDNPLAESWAGITAQTAVFVRKEKEEPGEDQFVVFAENCAHLGCGVSWFPQSGLFMCPCHGGVYYANGEHASGPPPRGLFHCPWRVEAGRLEIQAPHYPTLHDTLAHPSG